MREIKSIVGLRVISVEEGANVGTVSQVVVDLAQGTVLGLILGDGAAERGVLAADIQTLGADVIMVSSRAVARHLAELPELEARRQTSTNPLQVFTASGKRLGVVSSIFIDPYEKVVVRYEVSSGPLKDLADGMLILPILPGTIHGQDAVILTDEQVRQLGRESGGLRARFTQWSDTARKQVDQVSEQAEKIYGQVSEKAEKVYETGADTLKKDAQVVRERAVELSAQAKEAVTKLRDKEEAAPAAEGPAISRPAVEPDDIVPVVEQPDDIVAVPPHDPSTEAMVPEEPPLQPGPNAESTPTEQ